jgi:hypothetical protein
MELAIKQNSRGMTKLLCSIPYSYRCRLAEISQQHGIHQQVLIRSAIGKLIESYEQPAAPSQPDQQAAAPKTRKRGRK